MSDRLDDTLIGPSDPDEAQPVVGSEGGAAPLGSPRRTEQGEVRRRNDQAEPVDDADDRDSRSAAPVADTTAAADRALPGEVS
jgi:hypothetical protein